MELQEITRLIDRIVHTCGLPDTRESRRAWTLILEPMHPGRAGTAYARFVLEDRQTPAVFARIYEDVKPDTTHDDLPQCPTCGGTGRDPKPCPTAGRHHDGALRPNGTALPCQQCHGTKVHYVNAGGGRPCNDCGGEGRRHLPPGRPIPLADHLRDLQRRAGRGDPTATKELRRWHRAATSTKGTVGLPPGALAVLTGADNGRP